MADTQPILEAAASLGRLIQQHASYANLKAAVEALEEDVDAQRAMTDYNRHLEAISQKQQQGQPIEVEDKRKLDQLQKAVVLNPLLRDYQKAQMDYSDLMRQVDAQISGGPAIGDTTQPPPSSLMGS